MAARKIPKRLTTEEKELLPIARDAARVFLAQSENIEPAQIHAAITAALATFMSVLMNGGLYDQGYEAAMYVSKSLPGSVRNSKRVIPKHTKDPRDKLASKIKTVSSLLGKAASNSITGVSPETKHNVEGDVSTFMKLYSLLPFEKEKLYGHGDEVIPMDDSDYELNTAWLFPTEDLEGGFGLAGLALAGITGYLGHKIFGSSSSSSAQLPSNNATDDFTSIPDIPGSSNWDFFWRQAPTILQLGAHTLKNLHTFNREVLNPWAADTSEGDNPLKMLYRGTVGRLNKYIDSSYENSPHFKKWWEAKETGESIRQLGRMMEEGIPAIAKDYGLLQQKKRMYYQQLAHHRAQQKALLNQATIDEENAKQEAAATNRNIDTKNARLVSEQQQRHATIDEQNRKDQEEYDNKVTQWETATQIANETAKKAKASTDQAITLAIETELADSRHERQNLRRRASKVAGNVGKTLDIAKRMYQRRNGNIGDLIGVTFQDFSNVFWDLPEEFEANTEKTMYLHSMKNAFNRLRMLEEMRDHPDTKSAWAKEQELNARKEVLQLIDDLFINPTDYSLDEGSSGKQQYDRLLEYMEHVQTDGYPPLETIVREFLPQVRYTDIIGLGDGYVYFAQDDRYDNQETYEDVLKRIASMEEAIKRYDPSLIGADQKLLKYLNYQKKGVDQQAYNLRLADEASDVYDHSFKGEEMKEGVWDHKTPMVGYKIEEMINVPASENPREKVIRYLNKEFKPILYSDDALENAEAAYEYYATNNPYFKYIPRASELIQVPPKPVKPVERVKDAEYVKKDESYFNKTTGEYYDDRLLKHIPQKRVLSYAERLSALDPPPTFPKDLYDTPHTDKFLQGLRKQNKEDRSKPLNIPDLSSLFKVDKDFVTPVSSGKKGKAKMLTTLVVPAYRNRRQITTTPLQGLTAMRFGQPRTRFNVVPRTISRPSPHMVGATPSPLITLPKTSRIRPWR